MKNKSNLSRRKFLGNSALFMAGAAVVSPSIFSANTLFDSNEKISSLINGVQIGVITYSFRSMSDQSAEATLKYALDSGISAIELMGGPVEAYAGKPQSNVDYKAYSKLRRKVKEDKKLSVKESKKWDILQKEVEDYDKTVADWRASVPMDKFAELREMFNDAGVTIYAFKPGALRQHHTDGEIEWAMRTAKTLGASHVTVELPGDDAHTQRLGDLGEKNGVYVGYHGHTKQSPTWWDTALKQSKYNAINIDLGHYIAAGNTDALEFIQKHNKRIVSMHVKDRQTPENGKHNTVWGKGDTPIAEVLQLMRDKRYTFPATIEMEFKIGAGSNAVKEVANCLAYCRKALT